MDIRQFMNRKSISDSQVQKTMQTIHWEVRFNQHRLMTRDTGERRNITEHCPPALR